MFRASNRYRTGRFGCPLVGGCPESEVWADDFGDDASGFVLGAVFLVGPEFQIACNGDWVSLPHGTCDVFGKGPECGDVVEDGDSVAPGAVGCLEALVDGDAQLRVGDAGLSVGEFRVGDEVAVDADWDSGAHFLSLPFLIPAGVPGRVTCLAYDASIAGAILTVWWPVTGPVRSPRS